MAGRDAKLVAVLGATGLQGGAVAARLLAEGHRVRALTRSPAGPRAAALAAAGAEVVRADMFEIETLRQAFAGVDAVYSVQNHHIAGYDGEIRQGRNVADAVGDAAVAHLVYAAAGPLKRDTGVGSWDGKFAVADYARERGLPMTVLWPTAFMDLMTEPKYYPAASVWHLMPKLMGEHRPVGWLAVSDLAAIAARVIAQPEHFIGRDIPLASDVRSIAELRGVWRELAGRPPSKFPMPRWLFERFSGKDETTMWTWLARHDVEFDTAPARAVHPEALSVRAFIASSPAMARRSLEGAS
jgi:uncharacterized protein YbjT (DUF2867 family)